MNWHSLLMMAVIILVYVIGRKSIRRVVDRISREREIPSKRTEYVYMVLSLVWSILAFVALGMVAGVGYKDFGLFFTSVFAVLGVALFAQWSILSNVTASMIVFFFFPYRVGDKVRILDGENSVEGIIKEISLFHVILDDEQGNLLTYPNAMTFQKAVKVTPARRLRQQEREAEAQKSDLEC